MADWHPSYAFVEWMKNGETCNSRHTPRNLPSYMCASVFPESVKYIQTHFTHRNENLLRWWIDKHRVKECKRAKRVNHATNYVLSGAFGHYWWSHSLFGGGGTWTGHISENLRDAVVTSLKFYCTQLDIIKSSYTSLVCVSGTFAL